mmetsp:Transcript_3001/g.9055  ORF Transcript_3001/g.9055 Transcript_3001/m.9055 type:complete len:327 (+) Transcript_3001:595-1575(+)
MVSGWQEHLVLHSERGGPRLRHRGHLLPQGANLLLGQWHRGLGGHLRHPLVLRLRRARQSDPGTLRGLRERPRADHALGLRRQTGAHRHAAAVHRTEVGSQRHDRRRRRHADPAAGGPRAGQGGGRRAVLRADRPALADLAGAWQQSALHLLGGQWLEVGIGGGLPYLLRQHQTRLLVGLFLPHLGVRCAQKGAERAHGGLLGHAERREVHQVHQTCHAHQVLRRVLRFGHEGRRLERTVHHHRVQRHRQPGRLEVPPHRADPCFDDELARHHCLRGRRVHLDVPEQCHQAFRRPQRVGRHAWRQQAAHGDDVPHRRVVCPRHWPA